MWTDVVSAGAIMGARSIIWHPVCCGKEREESLEKGECLSRDLWATSAGMWNTLFKKCDMQYLSCSVSYKKATFTAKISFFSPNQDQVEKVRLEVSHTEFTAPV